MLTKMEDNLTDYQPTLEIPYHSQPSNTVDEIR